MAGFQIRLLLNGQSQLDEGWTKLGLRFSGAREQSERWPHFSSRVAGLEKYQMIGDHFETPFSKLLWLGSGVFF